jgi:hypothetical protein
MRFDLNAIPGKFWQLQGSPDLWHWGDYAMVTNQTETLAVTNTAIANPANYFYRAAHP